MEHTSARKEAHKVTLIGMYLDFVLGMTKLAGGFFSSSLALVADGLRSLPDTATGVLVLSVWHQTRVVPEASPTHSLVRYEAISTFLLAMVLFAIATIIVFASIVRLVSGQTTDASGWGALLVTGFSIASKERAFRFTMQSAE